MKKLLKPILLASSVISTFAFADTAPKTTTVENLKAATGAPVAGVEVNNQSVTVISPRTGIRYTLGNTNGRPIVLKTAAIAAVTPATANRIVASNPALSTSSQEKAKQALLDNNFVANN